MIRTRVKASLSSLLVGTPAISRQLNSCSSKPTPFSFIKSKLIPLSFRLEQLQWLVTRFSAVLAER
jgi:hypothetical protein